MKHVESDATQEIVEMARPMLAGRNPAATGAALAELTACWIAGHIVQGKPRATHKLVDQLCRLQDKMVRALVPIEQKRIHGNNDT